MNIQMIATLFVIGFGMVFFLVRNTNRKVLRQPVVIDNRQILNRRKRR